MFALRRNPILIGSQLSRISPIRLLHNSSSLFNKHFDDLTKSTIVKQEPVIKADKNISKYSKIIAKLPKRWQKYGERLIDSPIEHIVSFLTLHELSAVLPFLGLWYAFHTFEFLPTDIPSWIIVKGSGFIENIIGEAGAEWSVQERTRIIIEGATAYGIVKALFPVRVIASIFLTPWFSRHFIEPIFNIFRYTITKITGVKAVDPRGPKLDVDAEFKENVLKHQKKKD